MTNYEPPATCETCGQPTATIEHRLRSMLRLAMWAAEMTQEDLAEKIGHTPKHISQIFNDKVSLSLAMAEKIADAVGVRVVVGLDAAAAFWLGTPEVDR